MNRLFRTPSSFALSFTVSALLAACGGSGNPETAAADTSTTYSVEVAADATLAVEAQPLFHAAPVLLDEPAGGDDAHQAPHQQAVPEGLAQLSTRGLTVQGIEGAQRRLALSAPRALADGTAAPAATAAAVVTYSPSQIRAAYKLAALPTSTATLTADQAAALGAGQTIYIVNAKSNPNVAAELAAFNTKFGLPGCTTKAFAVTTALPLAAAKVADGCTLSVVNASASGATLSTTVPAYDAGWATEIALDVQWAHATAPLARIVLIQGQDASLNSLVSAIQLANKMGPGVVSMSFGTAEGSFLSAIDTAFTGTGMSYLAATGDWGTGVYWPAASAKVLAVGGTTLAYSGSGNRSETVWSGTGGGVSAQVALPMYQKLNVPGLTGLARRAVADVAFNANPNSGQYVAVQAPGTALKWISAGGTSLSTPQWAGLLAVANALRARSNAAVLGQPHTALYSNIGSVPGTYASAFGDVLSGSNGSCTVCSAKAGYDTPTGLGTPQGTVLLAALAGSPAVAPTPTPAPAPTPAPTPTPVAGISITSTGFTGVAGKALTGSITFNDPSNTSFSAQITGVPAGMSFAISGRTLTAIWAQPVTGNYTLNVTMRNAAGTTATKAVAVTVTAK